jgi:hypothetical protein
MNDEFKGYRRKQSWLNQDTIPAFFRRDYGIPELGLTVPQPIFTFLPDMRSDCYSQQDMLKMTVITLIYFISLQT